MSASESDSAAPSDSCDPGIRSVAISVSRDYGTKVDLIFRLHGLRKKRGFLTTLVNTFKKPTEPSKLCANAKFTSFSLTASSLQFSVDVRRERRKKGKKNALRDQVDTYSCHIKKFPSNINPDSAEFEIMEPASGDCFVMISVMKTSNQTVNWKEYQDLNGTIDVSES
ncbi:unnamed protein product [Enterobius vermicularis]|uniref:Chromobox-like protein 2 n=1 Tax=Enterobius vermicularis TaxID=51028 RepID=A0A0N4VGM2_ENTVE|nr:unnamed protein product [Enterobius vermicularis]